MINVLLIGPDYNSKGGIATVIKNYLNAKNNGNFSI